MKKNIILSFVLFVSLTLVSVYGQDDNSSEGSDLNPYGPRKGDFTTELLFGKGPYLNNAVVPSAVVSGNDNSAVNMIGVEVGYYLSNRWALILSGGTIMSNTPSQLGIPPAGGLPEYGAVDARENIDVNVTLGAQYLFKTGSTKLFPYLGVSLPYNYARLSTYDPLVEEFGEIGIAHTEVNSFGIQAVAGVDYYFTDEIFLGARIVPMAFNYASSGYKPAPGLILAESENTSMNFFVQPSISLGFNFGRRDNDGDGVPNKHDACPDVAGDVNGCPAEEEIADIDGDGIADDVDRCPYTAGPSETWGCPDYDGDGVLDLDEDDLCPGVPGPSANNGCPWPDTDGDGVLDKDDKCPEVAGPADNDGCPLISASAKDLIDQYALAILFESFSAEFSPGIPVKLDEIAGIMNDYPKATFLIEGHTDNVGTNVDNQKLSEDRANAVLNYLINEGGVDEDRLVANGVGETQPEFDNNTIEGRSHNRRVLVITTSD